MLAITLFLILFTVSLVGYTVIPSMSGRAAVLGDERQRKLASRMEHLMPRQEAKKIGRILVLAPLGMAGFFFFLFPPGMNLFGIVFGLIVGLLFPSIYIQALGARTRDKFNDQLVDALMIMSSSFRGGLSLVQALEAVIDEMPDPINKEFGIVLGENKMGVSLEEALNHLYSRMPLSAVQQINAERPDRLVQQMRDYFGGNLAGRRIAIWGLAFKPGTDDVRGAPSLSIISLLLRAGAEVIAYDPGANDKVRATLNGLIQYASDQYECIEKADALVVATEWEQFRHPDWGRLALAMKAPVIFDGRNIYDPEDMASKGFAYFGVGRSVVRPSALGGPGEPQIGVHGGSIGTVQERLRPVLGLETGSGFEGISQGHQRKGS